MNKKSKDARLCVSDKPKEINRKKEKHLIGIMRSLSVVLIVMLAMNCFSSFNYKLDYKVPETKEEKLEPIGVNSGTITSPLFFDVDITKEGSLIVKSSISKYSFVVFTFCHNTNKVYGFMSIFTFWIIPLYESCDESMSGYVSKQIGRLGNDSGLIGNYSIQSFQWLPLLPIQIFWSLFGDPNDSGKKKKLAEELRPIAYHLLKEQMAKDAIEATSTPANNNNPSTPTSGFTDTVVLKNGDFIENVKATVTIDSLIVTDANGKTTVYKKSQVLTVKKK